MCPSSAFAARPTRRESDASWHETDRSGCDSRVPPQPAPSRLTSAAMSRTANDYKMSGGFLPDFDFADPAPKNGYAGAIEDAKPWTKEDDLALKKVIADPGYTLLPDDQKPWPVIATKCNFGHNSGSCKARWAIISQQKDKYSGTKSIQFGAKGGAITGFVGQFKTPVAIKG